MTALVLMWIAFKYYGVSVTGLFSAEYIDAPWSWDRVVDLMQHLWLPVVILGLDGTARLARVMRANLLDELKKPYMEMARAKGLRVAPRYEISRSFGAESTCEYDWLVSTSDLFWKCNCRNR